MDPQKRAMIDQFWAARKVAAVHHGLMCLAIEQHNAALVTEHAEAYSDAMKAADFVSHDLNEAFPPRTINELASGLVRDLLKDLGLQLLMGSPRPMPDPPAPMTEEELKEMEAARLRHREERRKRREAETQAQAEKPAEPAPPSDPEPDPEKK